MTEPTPDPTLSDAALDAIEARVEAWARGDYRGNQLPLEDVPALIAALRQARSRLDHAQNLPSGEHPSECIHGEHPDAPQVVVNVRADLSHTGRSRDKTIRVDSCIADLVERLYPLTAASCCGHGQDVGRIMLDDGRWLLVVYPPIPEMFRPAGAWGFKGQNDDD